LPYIPIYEMFGINIPIFYFYALIFYFIAAVSVFLLARQLTKNNILALFAGAIFSAGFIGSDGIFRLFNSVQTSYSIMFVCLFFTFLLRFARKTNKWDYLIALVLFFVALETAFIRTSYLIFPTIVFLILFLNWRKIQDCVRNIIIVAPFLIIYKYIFSYSVDARAGLVKDYVNGILTGRFDYLHSFFGTLGNIVLPQPVQVILFDSVSKSIYYMEQLLVLELVFLVGLIFLINVILKSRNRFTRILFSILPVLWFVFIQVYFLNSEYIFTHSGEVDAVGIFSNFIGGIFLILQGSIILLLLKYGGNLAKIIIFLNCWLLANILAYSTYLPFTPLESINRYLTHSLAPYAILLPMSLYFFRKKTGILVLTVVIFTNMILSVAYQRQFIEEKSIPTIKFYAQLKKYLPDIKKGSVLYFDVANNRNSQQEFRDFFSVGSMPNTTAIAIRYGIDRYDFSMTSDYREFLSFSEGKPEESLFSFFYGPEGLVETTSITRINLENGRDLELADLSGLQKTNLSLVTPAILKFRAKVNPQVTVHENCTNFVKVGKDLLFGYLLSRNAFYRDVKIKTSSQERYQRSSLMVDESRGTLWRGNRGWWHYNSIEEVIVDLGSPKSVGQLLWVNGYANSTPTDYAIETSLDGEKWNNVKNVNEGGKKPNGSVVKDKFPPQKSRYVKLVIKQTFDNDSPAIGEIEAVEDKYVDIDKDNIQRLETEALCAENKVEFQEVGRFIKNWGIPGKVIWKTDKAEKNVAKFNFIADGEYHNYSVFLSSGGTKVTDLKINSLEISADILISDLNINFPTEAELLKIFSLQDE
ncbi:MAG: Uncharacterized protein G01um101493_116, partial [Microgenomates group bacterium Gr01-1014_93]